MINFTAFKFLREQWAGTWSCNQFRKSGLLSWPIHFWWAF